MIIINLLSLVMLAGVCIMTKKPAKDIDAIYASFELDECNYAELSEDERYHSIKKKWVMLSVMSNEITSMKLRVTPSTTIHHE
ncbi:Hypothetical protein PBPRA1718 [Photobacterium profundum SS9]|uniref:Uncharacterized protein n=4 Tax=Photobacterium TaxID=657 RepID=Q6LRF1_PHOPR|nr:Hypothetical protein PBPRA1718 [Photobacterium profundum SS9]